MKALKEIRIQADLIQEFVTFVEHKNHDVPLIRGPVHKGYPGHYTFKIELFPDSFEINQETMEITLMFGEQKVTGYVKGWEMKHK